ncbi:MAG: hypothetical protein HY283_02710 [Nitrospirae bacterium]|nr:hypothetical protein [Nitrospirota bacterium]
MPEKWESFVDHLKDTNGVLAKGELKTLVSLAKIDSDEFVKKQGVKLERYLNQLALGEITPEEFKGYVADLQTLTGIQSLKMQVAAKASAQRLCKGIEDIILNGLMRLLPS